MNNSEKAKEIARNDKLYGEDPDNNSKTDECYIAALEMAQWKDEQFKSILKLIYSKTLSIEKDVVIEQILKTQFDEEIDRNELNKEELKELFGKLKEVKL